MKTVDIELELELGPQQQCRDCGDHWPADEDFFVSEGRRGISIRCRACAQIYRARRHGREIPSATTPSKHVATVLETLRSFHSLPEIFVSAQRSTPRTHGDPDAFQQ